MNTRLAVGALRSIARPKWTLLSLACAGLLLVAGAPRARATTTPSIHWATPGPVRYGTPLNNYILQAWVSGALPGNFVYTPVAGTVLGAGTHTLSVTFNPTDTTDYSSVSTTVQLTVIQAVLYVSAFNYNGLSYGDTIPTFQYSIKPLVNGDTLSGAVSGVPSITTTAVQNSPVGQYPGQSHEGDVAKLIRHPG